MVTDGPDTPTPAVPAPATPVPAVSAEPAATTAAPRARFCPRCGQPSQGGAFCGFCGQPLSAGAPVSPGGEAGRFVAKAMPLELRPAGFWVRFSAYLIDWICLALIASGLGLAFGLLAWGVSGDPVIGRRTGLILGGVTILVLLCTYWPLLESSKAKATWGKRLCGLRVVDSSGGRLGLGSAYGRWALKILLTHIPYLGAVWLLILGITIGVDERKQGLHDRAVDSFVVHSR